jgi:hypothetical protein
LGVGRGDQALYIAIANAGFQEKNMKKIVALGLAGLLLTAGAASAKTATAVISLDGYCDTLTVNIKKNVVVGFDDPACETGIGVGYIAKTKNLGKAAIAGVQFPNDPGVQYVFEASYPFVTGGHWSLSFTKDGLTFNKFESGTYTVVTDPAAAPSKRALPRASGR